MSIDRLLPQARTIDQHGKPFGFEIVQESWTVIAVLHDDSVRELTEPWTHRSYRPLEEVETPAGGHDQRRIRMFIHRRPVSSTSRRFCSATTRVTPLRTTLPDPPGGGLAPAPVATSECLPANPTARMHVDLIHSSSWNGDPRDGVHVFALQIMRWT